MISFWRAIILQVCYFQNGNYLTLKKIISESSAAVFSKNLPDSTYFDVIRILDLLGIVEVSEYSGQIRWSCNWESEQVINFNSLQSPHTGKISFRFDFSEINFDLNSIEAVYKEFALDSFRKSLVLSLPEFSKVMEKCTSVRNWSEYVGDTEIEVFDFDRCKWQSSPSYLIPNSCLIKRKLDSGGYELMLALPQKNEARKILYGEWAFALALGMEKRGLSNFFQNGKLKLQSPVRLPSIMNRFLLSYSSEISLDFGIRYKLGDNEAVETINKWLGIANVSM